MSDLDVLPEVKEPGLDDHRVAHIVRSEDANQGCIGQEAEALCGHRWIPSRDPENLPVCQACADVMGRIMRSTRISSMGVK